MEADLSTGNFLVAAAYVILADMTDEQYSVGIEQWNSYLEQLGFEIKSNTEWYVQPKKKEKNSDFSTMPKEIQMRTIYNASRNADMICLRWDSEKLILQTEKSKRQAMEQPSQRLIMDFWLKWIELFAISKAKAITIEYVYSFAATDQNRSLFQFTDRQLVGERKIYRTGKNTILCIFVDAKKDANNIDHIIQSTQIGISVNSTDLGVLLSEHIESLNSKMEKYDDNYGKRDK